MKNILSILFLLLTSYNISFAQKEFEYINPPSIQQEDYTIDIDNIISKDDYCKFRLTINNLSNTYQAYDLRKVGFIYDNIGTYYPKKGAVKIIPPGEKISHTIRVDGNMNYMVEQFKVSLEGLLFATQGTALDLTGKTLEGGIAIDSKELNLIVKKVSNKKGRFSFTMNGEYSADKYVFMTLDPTSLTAKGEGNSLSKATISNKKFWTLQDGKKFNIIGDFQSTSSTLTLDWSDVLTRYTLSKQAKTVVQIYHTAPVASTPPVKTTKITTTTTTRTTNTTENITTNNTVPSTPSRPAAQNNCSQYVGNLSGQPVKVSIYSEEGECFQVKALGAYINPNYAQRVTFGFPIVGKVTIAMENGETFNKSILLNEDIYEVTYKIKRNKKGKYVTKMLLGTVGSTGPTAQELADQSAANLEKFKREQAAKSNDQLAEHRRRIAELDAKTEIKEERNNSSTSTTTNTTTSNTINRATNNNTTTNRKLPNSMHLRFMEGTNPLVNMRVEVSTTSGWTGTGTTDSNGDVYIDATNLNTKHINIYAKNSNTEYKLANVVKLDNNLFALIEPATLMLKTTNNLINAAQDGDSDAILDQIGW